MPPMNAPAPAGAQTSTRLDLSVNAAKRPADEEHVQCGFRRFASWQCQACGASQRGPSFLTSNPIRTTIEAAHLAGRRKMPAAGSATGRFWNSSGYLVTRYIHRPVVATP